MFQESTFNITFAFGTNNFEMIASHTNGTFSVDQVIVFVCYYLLNFHKSNTFLNDLVIILEMSSFRIAIETEIGNHDNGATGCFR